MTASQAETLAQIIRGGLAQQHNAHKPVITRDNQCVGADDHRFRHWFAHRSPPPTRPSFLSELSLLWSTVDKGLCPRPQPVSQTEQVTRNETDDCSTATTLTHTRSHYTKTSRAATPRGKHTIATSTTPAACASRTPLPPLGGASG